MRLDAARPYCQLPPNSELAPTVQRALSTRENHAATHCCTWICAKENDLRPRRGNIVALIDVANCIVGDPAMELGRLHAPTGCSRMNSSPDTESSRATETWRCF